MNPSADSLFKLNLTNETNGVQGKDVNHVEGPMGDVNCGSGHGREGAYGDSAQSKLTH